jgi:hypothetical protein
MDELVYGIFKPETVAYFQQVIGRMKDEGCDAVVLGCTEIPVDHERFEFSAADAGFHAPAGARRAAPSSGARSHAGIDERWRVLE